METALNTPVAAFISQYALGRDAHMVLRKRLQKRVKRIKQEFSDRTFVDSAQVLIKVIAEITGLGR